MRRIEIVCDRCSVERFEGTRRDAGRSAGWRCRGGEDVGPRCVEKEKLAREAAPVMPARRNAKYGSRAYVEVESGEREIEMGISEREIRRMLGALKTGNQVGADLE